MPIQDSRRINGPQESMPLSHFQKPETENSLLNSKQTRMDGRLQTEFRPMYMKTGVITKANGSSYLETSGTKLVCGVYGPRDIGRRHEYSSQGQLACELTYAPFSRKVRQKPHSDYGQEISNHLLEALQCAICFDSFPKAQVDIYVTVLEDNGNTLSHAIVAASLALANAGIEMYDMVTSCSMVLGREGYCLDPSHEETCHAQALGSMTLAYLPAMNQISCMLTDGEQELDSCKEKVNICIEACLRIHAAMRDCLTSQSLTSMHS